MVGHSQIHIGFTLNNRIIYELDPKNLFKFISLLLVHIYYLLPHYMALFSLIPPLL